VKVILVAEDDQATRELVREVLSSVPAWVVTAVEDGIEALERLDTVIPDLLVLDVHMPGFSGLEVYRLLRQREGMVKVPVLFVSGEKPAQTDLPVGTCWLSKPFNATELVLTVAYLLGEEVADREACL